ncbi:ABC transporter permease [Aureimonas frigidaquae]|uniref:Permease protein, ABC-type amino acid transporter n=1 Tax=Aureimonas frigidaquae TaxID=424757 RepID=A0A0P0Z2H7_9HYPH|nr:ABC transporter permease [Aureimonas frigidaquae]BAT28278.1 permease protein, ABC-type amino acid transporter [Aureimonas frigidaquae]
MSAAALRRRRPGLAGALALSFWAAVAIGIAVYLHASWNPAFLANYGMRYLDGLWVTVQFVVLSFLCGAVLSVPLAFGRMSGNRLIRGIAYAYVSFFRGTPFIAQIFLIYYGFGSFRGAFESVGLWWFFRDAWYCAIFAMSLNTAAYQGEILRGAIRSVPRGQWEGARSLGISPSLAFVKIILPQALMVALRPYANEVILVTKASAIIAIITIFDLFGVTRRAYSQTYDFQAYVWAALIYLLIVETVRNLTALAERRLTRHLKR